MGVDRGGFIFYPEWFHHVEVMDNDKDKLDFLMCVLKYGIDQEEYQDASPQMKSLAKLWTFHAIDSSRGRYLNAIANGNNGGRPKTIDEEAIYNMAREGNSAKQISIALKIPENTIYKSEGWKHRKEEDFVF